MHERILTPEIITPAIILNMWQGLHKQGGLTFNMITC